MTQVRRKGAFLADSGAWRIIEERHTSVNLRPLRVAHVRAPVPLALARFTLLAVPFSMSA
jgi:hypothetical protein